MSWPLQRIGNQLRRMEERQVKMLDQLVRMEGLMVRSRRVPGSTAPRFYDRDGNECIFPAAEPQESNGIGCPACGTGLYDVGEDWEKTGYECRATGCAYKGWGA